MQWYVSENGRTSGPFTEQRISMLVNWGKISHEAYICDEQWSCWVSVMRSQFAPLLVANGAQARRDSQLPRALSEPPAPAASLGHRLALALLLMLAAAAFLLAVWLAPDTSVPGPLGHAGSSAPYTSAPAGEPPQGA